VTVPDRLRRWRKSSHSQTDNCVEVALGETVGVRDTKGCPRDELAVTSNAWRAFTAAIRG
jgi:hypothetical protein